jgi:hypothetical protein
MTIAARVNQELERPLGSGAVRLIGKREFRLSAIENPSYRRRRSLGTTTLNCRQVS